MDWEKLGKLMRLTESEHDGEAINALRMANRMLAAEGLNWSDVAAMLARPRIPRSAVVVDESHMTKGKRGTARYGRRADQSRPKDTRRHEGDDVRAMLDEMARRKHDMMSMVMVAGFKEHFDKHGYLTGAQYDALKGMHSGKPTGGRTTWQFW